VIVVGEDATSSFHQSIERLGDADVEALHPSRQRFVSVRLDEQVQVVAENRELDDPQPEPLARRREGGFDDFEAAATAEVPDMPGHAQGHVHSGGLLEARAAPMRDQRPPSFRLAPGSRPLAAPLRQSQCELSHLIGD